jgi:glycosyltransferase involved in cell wall biosynthesis
MRVLVVTKIFPSSLEPLSAPFNRQQIGELARCCDVQVLAAVPHVPFARALSAPARAARLASLPARESVHGVDVTYVRQLYVPRVGLPVAVPLYLASLLPHRDRLRAADVILATWAYPDGCASVVAARALDKPCVVKVHGTDVNVVLQRGAARRVAGRILPLADAVVAVSRPLGEELARMGVAPARIHQVDNGVDASVFFARDRGEARAALDVPSDARVVLFVGRLEPQKGIRELLGAFNRVHARIPRAMLALVGDGVSREEVRARTAPLGQAVRVLGPLPQAQVAAWMGACDVLTLPSWAEGMPNVVLEALASGRPVVATRVGGIPDALRDDRAGLLVPPRDAAALADALVHALHTTWDEDAVRACGPRPWRESAAALREVLESVTANRTPARSVAPSSATRSASQMPARTRSRTRPTQSGVP